MPSTNIAVADAALVKVSSVGELPGDRGRNGEVAIVPFGRALRISEFPDHAP